MPKSARRRLVAGSSGGGGTGAITVQFQAPIRDGDGLPITDIASYKVYWGTTYGAPSANSGAIASPTVANTNMGVTNYTYTTPANLVLGTWYLYLTTTDTTGNESAPSYMGQKAL